MRSLLWIFLLGAFSFGKSVSAQEIIPWDIHDLRKTLASASDTFYVINFWATWCKPCVEELPYFEDFHQRYKHEKIKVILVSLDFASQINSKVKPLLRRLNITSTVALMTDTDYNQWIDWVSKDWQGAIPATLFMHKPSNTRIFINESLSFEQIAATFKKTKP